jgi:D-alanine-D-alanine ligase
MCQNDAEGWAQIRELGARFDPLLIEERIHGTEVTAGVIGHSLEPVALPLVRIRPAEGFYDYRAKYTSGATDYECPASVPEPVAQLVQSRAALLYSELDLDPYARLDFIIDSLGEPWFLEANTLPGFTDLSLLPMAAGAAGVEMGELLEILMLLALERSEAAAGNHRQPPVKEAI